MRRSTLFDQLHCLYWWLIHAIVPLVVFFWDCKVFLTCTDCNVDYSSPLSFDTGIRSIARVGELHVSSILVAGATMQAFKISLADFSLFVCHSRCPHNAENAVLACSRRIFPAHDLLTVPSKQSQSRYHGSSSRGKSNSFDLTIQSLPFEDALGTMGFVSLLF